jgi:hypothetical protein
MADYADWTESIELLGSEVMVPFDVQGAYIQVPMDLQGALIQMPVDIQGQYIDLKVDIVAQTVGSIAIDISAQTIGNLAISVSAQSVGVYLQPEWAAKAGIDKDFQGEMDFAAGYLNTYVVYTVPAGKAFLVNQVGLIDMIYVGQQTYAPPLSLSLAEYYGGFYYWKAGASGAGGGVSNLVKPAYFTAGHEVRIRLGNASNVAVRLCYFISGYEISV